MKNWTGSGTAISPEFLRNLRWNVGLKPGTPFISFSKFVFDFLAIVEIVCQSRINIGKRYPWKHLDDFFRTVTTVFMPSDDILNTNSMPNDTRPATTYARRLFNVFV